MDNSQLNPNPNNLKQSQIQSPYLNPSTLPDQISSEFIIPEGASHRGRFELAFSQIGASVMIGSGLGGALGTYKGLKETSQLEAFLSVKRTQILNYITRNGARMANTFGTIALTYSAIGVGLSFIQDSNDDANTLVSAILSGALYGALSKPSTDPIPTGQKLLRLRMKRTGFGSLFGAVAASAYILYFNRDKYIK
ncbi:mitochondrial import inner membrane translocase subunit Tim23-like protein [Sarcoptes scabiei]|uniref:Mitochondrial import inner membrane translocase subunit Tim23-like protein n=1 Tax=Sarcoptes scabiei TaxID=52283 RepID=A0A132AJY1_SARSC|nr:mitochondrial import inner membrane translocase subunit Tim23-like protein [Sarcoptes scabiei]